MVRSQGEAECHTSCVVTWSPPSCQVSLRPFSSTGKGTNSSHWLPACWPRAEQSRDPRLALSLGERRPVWEAVVSSGGVDARYGLTCSRGGLPPRGGGGGTGALERPLGTAHPREAIRKGSVLSRNRVPSSDLLVSFRATCELRTKSGTCQGLTPAQSRAAWEPG